MNMIRLSGILLLIFVLLPLSITACGEPSIPAERLIPEKADMLVCIRVNKIVNDRDFKNIYDVMTKEPDMPGTAREALDMVKDEIGIDLESISQAVMFMDFDSMDLGYFGFIVEGNFDNDKFTRGISSQMDSELSTQQYQGLTVYTSDTDDMAICFLNNKTLVISSIAAIEDVIDVHNGDSAPLRGQVVDTYNRLGNVLVKMAMVLPEEARQELSGGAGGDEIPFELDSFADIDVIGASLTKSRGNLYASIQVEFLNEASAQDVEEGIKGLLGLARGMMEEDEKEMLDNIDISVKGSRLEINYKIYMSDIEEQVKNMGDFY